MEAREFTAYVILREPETLSAVTFAPGDEVPEWAYDLVGDHVSQGVTRARQTSHGSDAHDVVAVAPAAVTEVITPEYELTPEDEPAEEPEEVQPYDEWTKADLKAEAKGRELHGYSTASKEELVELLEQDDAENME